MHKGWAQRRLLKKKKKKKAKQDNNSYGSGKEIRNGKSVFILLHIHCGRWLVKVFATTLRVIIPQMKAAQVT